MIGFLIEVIEERKFKIHNFLMWSIIFIMLIGGLILPLGYTIGKLIKVLFFGGY